MADIPSSSSWFTLHKSIVKVLYYSFINIIGPLGAYLPRPLERLPTPNDPKPFDVVVSLCAYTLPVGWLVKELRFAFPDGQIDPEMYADIERVADWAYAEWKDGKRVLIRCQAGMNRSSLVTCLVLMRDGWSAADAIALLRDKRSEYVLSNQHFLEYVESWVRPQSG